MQVNTTKHQTWHSNSPSKHKQNVNKSYHITTEVEDEYTEDEFKDEYNSSVYFRKRGQDTQEWLDNYRAYHSGNQWTKQSAKPSANLLAHQSGYAKIQGLQKRVSEQPSSVDR